MRTHVFVTIDFDGTVVDADITDVVIERYARPGWKEAERAWEEGRIGSRECLKVQMSLIGAPLDTVMKFIDRFSVNESFPPFIEFLEGAKIPFCIVSDGFRIFIEHLLNKAGLGRIPVHANLLEDGVGGLATRFLNTVESCEAGTCKCLVARNAADGLPVIHIGDGRSDICLAKKAFHVFSKGILTEYCREHRIPHTPFTDFRVIEAGIRSLVGIG